MPTVTKDPPPIDSFTTNKIGREARFPACSSRATFLTDGLDNAYAQTRARHALFYLHLNGHPWPAHCLGDHLAEMLAEAGIVE